MTATADPRFWHRSPWRFVLWAIPTALLVTPAIMMAIQADGWLWTPFDFVFAVVLLLIGLAMFQRVERSFADTV